MTKIKYYICKTIIVLLIILVACIIFKILNIDCGVKWLTGVSCPTCGLTRSLISFLKLDFESAIYYHALSIPMSFYFLYIVVVEPTFSKKSKWLWVISIVIISALLGYYIYRLFYLENDVVICDFSNSIIMKMLNR